VIQCLTARPAPVADVDPGRDGLVRAGAGLFTVAGEADLANAIAANSTFGVAALTFSNSTNRLMQLS